MSYERYESQRRRPGFGASSRRTTFGYWVPLALTVTVATVGLAAWVWKERGDGEEDYPKRNGDRPAADPDRTGREFGEYDQGAHQGIQDDPGFVARMSGALRRTPSPQQLFDEAGRRVVAGVAAAGAAVGGALTSIREEGKGDYEDHSRWSEEAAARAGIVSTSRPVPPGEPAAQPIRTGERAEHGRRVAIVISAESNNEILGSEEGTYLQEHASILSHLPEHVDDNCRVFVLIYTPDIHEHPLSTAATGRPTASITSSYSNIGHEDLQTPTEELDRANRISPKLIPNSNSRMFNALYDQARALVDRESMIMPFTTPGGYVNLLRHVNPSIVYVQATLSGDSGAAVKQVSGWAGQVVLVVGDDTGHGGLVDSEDEQGAFADRTTKSWWRDDSSVGLGKGIEVVEGLRMGEDWKRRVKGHN